MRYGIFFFVLCSLPFPGRGQTNEKLTLQACYERAKAHYPLLQQDTLLKQQLALAQKNLEVRYLPRLTLQGRATYQSDVTTIPVKLPGMEIPEVAKDQYQGLLDVSQLLFDGGTVRKQKALQQVKTALALQAQKITFHQLKKRLNDNYAGLLIIQAKKNTLLLQQATLEQQLKKTRAAVQNGVALPSRSDELQVALLKVKKQIRSLETAYQGGLRVLSLLTGKQLNPRTRLVLPEKTPTSPADRISRPELKIFALQNQLFEQQSALLKHTPKLSAFVQGGYGRPGLNMLNNEFDWFYRAGIRLNWHFWDWHEQKRKQASLQIEARRLQLKKENFMLTTHVQLARAHSDIQALEENINKDKQIAQLRHQISTTASAQLAHGIITPTEYLIKLNNETTARIQQHIDLIRLRFARINYQLLKQQ